MDVAVGKTSQQAVPETWITSAPDPLHLSRARRHDTNHFLYVIRAAYYYYIRECGNTPYVGMAQGVSFSLYIGIGAKFENTQKIGERRLRTAKYRTVLL